MSNQILGGSQGCCKTIHNLKVEQAIKDELLQDWFDQRMAPIIKATLDQPKERFDVALCPEKVVSLSGAQIQKLSVQLRAQLPALSQNSWQNHQFEINLPEWGQITLPAEEVFRQIGDLKVMSNQSSSLQDAWEEYCVVSGADIQEISENRKSKFEHLFSELSSLGIDPGNPEKGKKYAYVLYTMAKQIPNLEELINFLEDARQNEPQNLFAKHACFALYSLSQCSEPEREKDIRFWYGSVLEHLRRALEESVKETRPEYKDAFKALQSMCHAKFTRVYMYPYLEDIVSKALRAPQPNDASYELPEFRFDTLASDLRNANNRLRSVPAEYRQTGIVQAFKKFQGAVGIDFDPNAASNTPWVHSIQQIKIGDQDKICTVLRHATPTRDLNVLYSLVRYCKNDLNQTSIIPEFRAHLSADLTKQTLYINHQVRDLSSWNVGSNAEAHRSSAIETLQTHFKNFYVLSLPMDGAAWDLANKKESSLNSLQESLLNFLLEETNGFSLPKKFQNDKDQIGKDVAEILNQVKSLYFPSCSSWSVSQKRAFIMLFYSELKNYFKAKCNIDFITSACKDNKDRGNVSANTDMLVNLIKLGKENDPEQLKEAFFSVLGPFVIKNEAILTNRLEVLLDVIEALAHLDEAQKEALRQANITPCKITEQQVPKESANWGQMVSNAEFFQCIDHMKKAREKRIIVDRSLKENVANSFLQGNDLQALRKQIEKDLPRTDIRVQNQRILDFNTLCEHFEIEPALFEQNPENLTGKQLEAVQFLSLLNQAPCADLTKDPSHYLRGPNPEVVVAQRSLSSQRKAIIKLIEESQNDVQAALEKSLKLQGDPDFSAFLQKAVDTDLLPAQFAPSIPPTALVKDPIFPTQILAEKVNDEWHLEIHQELELRNPEGTILYPIQLDAYQVPGKPIKISWEFVS